MGVCDEAVAGAITTLTVDELVAYICYGGDSPEEVVVAMIARLRERGMQGMLEVVEKDDSASLSSPLSGSLSVYSSSNEELAVLWRMRRRSRRWSATTGRERTEQ